MFALHEPLRWETGVRWGRGGAEKVLNLRTIKYIWNPGSFTMRYPLNNHKSGGRSVLCPFYLPGSLLSGKSKGMQPKASMNRKPEHSHQIKVPV